MNEGSLYKLEKERDGFSLKACRRNAPLQYLDFGPHLNATDSHAHIRKDG